MAKYARNLGDYYTIQGAAEQLGLTFWRVYGFIRRRKVPTIRVGRNLMVRLSDLSGLKEEGEVR